jgi:A/G-specific adenine glycosylase
MPLPFDKAKFQQALLDWYHANRRRLPWREEPSLYRTVVSELMLQQTQIKTVLPYFARWMEALPSFEALAAAPEAQVLKLWEGLGYYSRARNLHRLAKAVAALPAPPRTPQAWRELPGVGPYTAAAVTSIAFGHPVACVDGNVVRILARITANPAEFRDSASASKAFTPLADELVSTTSPGDHNQAMMELGATVCTKHNPLCTVCPVFNFCAGQRTGEPERFPKLASKYIEQLAVTRVWCVHDGKLLLHRAPSTARRFADMHEIPSAEQAGLDESAVRSSAKPLAKKKRGITRYAITETFYDVSTAKIPTAAEGKPDLVWLPLHQLDSVTLSGPHRRWTKELLGRD